MKFNSLKKLGTSIALTAVAASSFLIPVVHANDVKVTSPVATYRNAYDATSNQNRVGTYSAGSYYIYKEFNGAVNITKTKGVPGAWVAKSKLQTVKAPAVKQVTTAKTTTTKAAPKPTTTTTKKVAPKPAKTTTKVAPKPATTSSNIINGDQVRLSSPVKVYMNAYNAELGISPVTSYGAGNYYVFREYGNAVNITRTKGQAGGWVAKSDLSGSKNVKSTTSSTAKKVEVKEKASTNSITDKMVELARAQVGKAYIYGGSNPNYGFDCSGLVQWIYRQVGISIPRTADVQGLWGREVPLNDLKPGDLLFFGDTRYSIQHVSIYVGDGRSVHALNENAGIIERSLSNSWDARKLRFARRFVD